MARQEAETRVRFFRQSGGKGGGMGSMPSDSPALSPPISNGMIQPTLPRDHPDPIDYTL